jgi:hypothetical protein
MFNQAASVAVFFFMHAPNPLANNGSQEVGEGRWADSKL